ncbi:MAG: alpha/beta hydrolase fold domain-containing protein [Candidatus Helarchaeota archaeon]
MKFKNFLKNLILLACYLLLVIGVIITILWFFFSYTLIGIVVCLALPTVSILLPFIYIVPTVIIIKFHLQERKKYAMIVFFICAFIVFTCFLPIISLPIYVYQAESQMVQTFGSNYTSLNTQNMLQQPFSLWTAINGFPVKDSELNITLNVKYYNNENDSFYFDCYKPKGTGPFPVIIAIHGGAWVIGNKGVENNVPFSKYIASQGYVVFDINYGIFNIYEAAQKLHMESVGELLHSLIGLAPGIGSRVLPAYNQSYTIPEQVENIGHFTHFLAENYSKFNADINNVFLLGRSAGAHMASVVGTGYYNGIFGTTFNQTLNVKGIVLFYPPTDLKKMKYAVQSMRLTDLPAIAPAFDFLLNESANITELNQLYRKYSAYYLIQNSSVTKFPSIIILHGTLDNLVPYWEQGYYFQQEALAQNVTSILVSIPLAGHGFDFISSGYGGQMSTYFIERFLALEVS